MSSIESIKTEKQSLVSIIMPAYNAEKFISQAIESIINQTYTDWELLICDDASIDNTKEIIERYARVDSRIITSHNSKNLKLLKTRNRLLKLAKGDYITFQDADDYSDYRRLENCVKEFINNSDLGLLSSNVGIVDKNGQLLYVTNRPVEYSEVLKKIYSENVLGGSYMMIKRKIFEEFDFQFREYFDGLSNQDYDLSFLIAQKHPSYNLGKVLYYYRQLDTSASKQIRVERLVAEKIVKWLGIQRDDFGYDYLMKGDKNSVDEYFSELLLPYKQDITLVNREFASKFMYAKLHIAALSVMLDAIRKEPLKIENWRTFQYCSRKSFLSLFTKKSY